MSYQKKVVDKKRGHAGKFGHFFNTFFNFDYEGFAGGLSIVAKTARYTTPRSPYMTMVKYLTNVIPKKCS